MTKYPFVVERLTHASGKGYAIEVRTDREDAGRVQLYVSEDGSAIRVVVAGDMHVETRPPIRDPRLPDPKATPFSEPELEEIA